MTTIKRTAYHTPVPSEEDLLRLNDVFHLMHPDAYPFKPQDVSNVDGNSNSLDSYYHMTDHMFVVDVPQRRRLHTFEQESNPHLLAGGPEDDDEMMDDMNAFFPRHRVEVEQEEWGAHLLVVTEVDELVAPADETPIYHYPMDMKDIRTLSLFSKKLRRARPLLLLSKSAMRLTRGPPRGLFKFAANTTSGASRRGTMLGTK